MIVITSNYSDMDKELDRLESMPTPKMILGLETVLELGFTTSQAAVHVDTGRLKASGKKISKANKGDWKGEFSFKARNNEGTTYGIYERDRGGSHDFFNQVALLKELFKAAIVAGLKR